MIGTPNSLANTVDQGYLNFFCYLTFFNTSILGLVTSSNLIQICFFGIGWNVLLVINRILVHTIFCGECLSRGICNQSRMRFLFIIRNIRFYWIKIV